MSTRKFYELVNKCRSIRRFDESVEISRETLLELIDLARLSPTAGNNQPLRFSIVKGQETCNSITGLLGWAGALKDWDRPAAGERPSAYIIILFDTLKASNPKTDSGIAAHTILLGAVEKGLGGCMFGSIKREQLQELLKIDRQFSISLVVALGKPAEQVVIEQVSLGEDLHYYRDNESVHHVPKIKLNDLVLNG
ncbi:MAG: nitroreductase family protein [Spirochaetales bacterium]|nr:nitroreductase family protein [Spirochaetales bacterium]